MTGKSPQDTAAPAAPTAPARAPQGGAADAPWTTRRLLKWIEEHLEAKGVDSARVCAQMLVSHVLQCDRLKLYMEADRPASKAELESLRALVGRAAKHEPVQYLVGEAWFWSKRFEVGRATLIPRPCTEHLVEFAVKELRERWSARAGGGEGAAGAADAVGAESAGNAPQEFRVLEIGTGTGCIAVSIALALKAQPSVPVRVVATDIVPEALELAKRNASAHGVADHIEFACGDLYAPLAGRGYEKSFDVLVSNPPYVADNEWDALAPNVREYEPRSALAGGPQGMNVIRQLLAAAHQWLRPGGKLILEFGNAQADVVRAEAERNANLGAVELHKDFEDLWRVLTARTH